jgi:hypothetical protein
VLDGNLVLVLALVLASSPAHLALLKVHWVLLLVHLALLKVHWVLLLVRSAWLTGHWVLQQDRSVCFRFRQVLHLDGQGGSNYRSMVLLQEMVFCCLLLLRTSFRFYFLIEHPNSPQMLSMPIPSALQPSSFSLIP